MFSTLYDKPLTSALYSDDVAHGVKTSRVQRAIKYRILLLRNEMGGYKFRHFEKKGRDETRPIEGKRCRCNRYLFTHTRTAKNWTVAGYPVGSRIRNIFGLGRKSASV
jgi:hypothetical protein